MDLITEVVIGRGEGESACAYIHLLLIHFFRKVLVETCTDYLFEHPVIYIRIGQEISVHVELDFKAQGSIILL